VTDKTTKERNQLTLCYPLNNFIISPVKSVDCIIHFSSPLGSATFVGGPCHSCSTQEAVKGLVIFWRCKPHL